MSSTISFKSHPTELGKIIFSGDTPKKLPIHEPRKFELIKTKKTWNCSTNNCNTYTLKAIKILFTLIPCFFAAIYDVFENCFALSIGRIQKNFENKVHKKVNAFLDKKINLKETTSDGYRSLTSFAYMPPLKRKTFELIKTKEIWKISTNNCNNKILKAIKIIFAIVPCIFSTIYDIFENCYSLTVDNFIIDKENRIISKVNSDIRDCNLSMKWKIEIITPTTTEKILLSTMILVVAALAVPVTGFLTSKYI
jgi:hypothetical protein